jgi:hypothetical protein
MCKERATATRRIYKGFAAQSRRRRQRLPVGIANAAFEPCSTTSRAQHTIRRE